MKKQFLRGTIVSLAKCSCCALVAAVSPCSAGTAIFANTSVVTINDSSRPFRIVPATPYPSTISVSGFPPSEIIQKVAVTLHNLRHGTPDDIDILLVGPGGQNVIIFSDAGGGFADPDVPITITLDDEAASEVPDNGPDIGSLAAGTYRPSNFESGDVFPTPAPAPSSATGLAVFAGTNPNGDWHLYLVDDDVFDAGSIDSGWSVTIVTAEPSSDSFASWAARFGLSGDAAAPNSDPESDGLPNAAEYILGGNPAEPAASGRPTISVSGPDLIFIFSRNDASETPDVSLTVESGADLMSWPTVFTIGPGTASSSTGVSVTENGTAPDIITVTIPPDGSDRKFARLKVNVSP